MYGIYKCIAFRDKDLKIILDYVKWGLTADNVPFPYTKEDVNKIVDKINKVLKRT